MKDDILALIHTLIILFAWASPFWLTWKIIFPITLIYFLQIIIFKSCIITNLQFNKNIKKTSDITMAAYWANKLGYRVNKKILKLFSDYINPTLIIIITVIWQIILKKSVIISF